MSGRRVAKRACDGFNIRNIKCTEVSPCQACVAAEIPCTFVKTSSIRGPRKLRKSTLQEIRQTQQQWEDSGLHVPTISPLNLCSVTASDPESAFAPNKVASLVLQLCVYRLRMFSVWPIIKVERLVAAMQKKPAPDVEVICLAYAVAAATMAQIATENSSQPSGVTAEMMEAQCQYTKARLPANGPPTISTVRIAFFQHIYFENQDPGGMQSILYLREAISMAHLLGLHRQSYYKDIPIEEQQIRRRTLWLLFVTERGVSILHRLPVILRPTIAFPNTDDTDEADVLSAFQTLIKLFWSFDRSGIFDLLDCGDIDPSEFDSSEPSKKEAMASACMQLDQQIETDQMNDVQALDISATRQWMRIILWRLSESHGVFANASRDRRGPIHDPIEIAREFLATVSLAPKTAFEAHGPGLQLKVFEVASSVVDAIELHSTTSDGTHPIDFIGHQEVLVGLRKLIISNIKLDTMLCEKMATIRQNQMLPFDFSGIAASDKANSLDDTGMDLDIAQQLQRHGFDFSEPLNMSASPGSESQQSSISNKSPLPTASQSQAQSQGMGITHSLSNHSMLLDQGRNQVPNVNWNLLHQDPQSMNFDSNFSVLLPPGFDSNPNSIDLGLPPYSRPGWSNQDSTGMDLNSDSRFPTHERAPSWNQKSTDGFQSEIYMNEMQGQM